MKSLLFHLVRPVETDCIYLPKNSFIAEMSFIQHSAKLGKSSFKSFCLSLFLLLCAIEISQIVRLRFFLKPMSCLSSKNRY